MSAKIEMPAKDVFDVFKLDMRLGRSGTSKNAELKQSIREHKVMQAVTLATYDPPHLIVADGNDRVRICRELVEEGLEEHRFIPGVIDPSLDYPAVLRMIIETEKRSNRHVLDIGRHVKAFMDGLKPPTQKATAAAMQSSESSISRVLLPFIYGEDVIALVAEDKLTLSHLAAVNPLRDLQKQAAVLKEAAEKGLSSAATKLLAFPPKRPKTPSKTFRLVEGPITITLPVDLTFEQYDALTAKIKERLATALRDLKKSSIKVSEIEPTHK